MLDAPATNQLFTAACENFVFSFNAAWIRYDPRNFVNANSDRAFSKHELVTEIVDVVCRRQLCTHEAGNARCGYAKLMNYGLVSFTTLLPGLRARKKIDI